MCHFTSCICQNNTEGPSHWACSSPNWSPGRKLSPGSKGARGRREFCHPPTHTSTHKPPWLKASRGFLLFLARCISLGALRVLKSPSSRQQSQEPQPCACSPDVSLIPWSKAAVAAQAWLILQEGSGEQLWSCPGTLSSRAEAVEGFSPHEKPSGWPGTPS